MDRRTKCVLFRWLRPHHFLVLMAITTLGSFILGYAISVSLDKVHPLFPYISDTGTTKPASCYFGLLLNLASVFAAISMYFRHGFLEKQDCLPSLRLHTLNDVALLLGLLSAFGIMLVANFQETGVMAIHLLGATMTFLLGNCYCWIHTYLSRKTVNQGLATNYKVYLRAVLSFLSTLGFIMTVVGANLAMKGSKGINLKWTSDQEGYTAHLVSAFSEWVMGISFVVFFLTFVPEFQSIRASMPLQFVRSNAPNAERIVVSDDIYT